MGLHSSEEEEDFLNRKQQKDIQIWLDTQMQVSMENQLSVGDMKNIDVLLGKKEQEAVASELPEETQAAVKEVVEEVLENAEAESDEVPVSSEAAEPTIYDKYAKAFGLDQFEINR